MPGFWPGFLALEKTARTDGTGRTGHTDGTYGTDGRAGRDGRTGRTDGPDGTDGRKYSFRVLLGRRNTVLQYYWDGEIQCTFLLGQRNTV